jgi:hypothetical protein
MFTTPRSAKPLVSLKVNVKVWLDPAPRAGSTLSAESELAAM